MTDSIIAAFATDNGKTFMARHFGDAKKFLIYRISASEAELVNEIKNSSEEDDETVHADPRKAGSIAKLLKSQDVNVCVSKIFGPNIKRIRKKFVCIISQNQNISDSISTIQFNFTKILAEWNRGEERDYLKI